jgi:copper chaperone
VSTEEQAVATATYLVTGMSCDHCTRAVAGEFRNLAGVTDVTVRLVPGGQSAVTVVSSAPVATGAIAAALHEAGEYLLVSGTDG